MKEIVIEAAIKAFVPQLIRESSDVLDKATDEIKQLYNKGLKDYFTKQKEKYSHIKTLLQGNTPVYLYDIYFPINIRKNYKRTDTSRIQNLFTDTNFITIVGSAGSGKSMLVKHLFLNSITEKYGIPILIELRHLNEYQADIEKYIEEVIFENKLSQNPTILKRLLEKGKFIFFLDGFDEISGNIRGAVVRHISSFVNEYDENKFILTSRPYANIEFLPLFHNCQIQPLNEDEILNFIGLQLRDEGELTKNIIDSIENSPPAHIHSFLSNPLLLSLYILTFQNNSDIPSKKYIFYRRVIHALFSEHDSKSKLGFAREKTSQLSQEKIEEILKRFSFLTFFDAKYDFEIDYILFKFEQIKTRNRGEKFSSQLLTDDLKLAISLWVEDGNKIKFAHRSLQEYFAALFIKELKEDQKNSVYAKVIESLSRVSEADNFLSLCEEMDEVSYLELFLIPAIEIAISNTDPRGIDEYEFISKIISQTYSSIEGWESGQSNHGYVQYPLRKIRDINDVLQDMYTFLSTKIDEVTFFGKVNVEGWQYYEEYGPSGHLEQVWWLDLTSIPEEITAYMKDSGIMEAVKGVRDNLMILKGTKEKYVLDSEQSSKRLIDLI